MLDIQNMKVSKAIIVCISFLAQVYNFCFWQGNRDIAGIENVR